MLLSDQYKNIYTESEFEREATLTLIRKGLLDEKVGRERIHKSIVNTLINSLNAALKFISDECDRSEGLSSSLNLKNFEMALVKSINAFRCAYRELLKELEVDQLYFKMERFEQAMFDHYTHDMSSDVVDWIKSVYKKHKFSYEEI